MVNQIELHGYEEFSKYIETVDPKGPPVLLYFSGAKLPSGESWCSDCCEDYAHFTAFVDKLPNEGPKVYFFFTGKRKDNGHSWCIFCQMAEPVVNAYLSELKKDIIFAYVDVGNRETWKDMACSFRTDSRLKLMVIPTMIVWKGVQRLEGSQCNKRELLQMLFEDED